MGEFDSIAERLAGSLSRVGKDQKVSRDQLEEMTIEAVGGYGGPINFYPSGKAGACHELVVVVSLIAPSLTQNQRGHLGFNAALELLVRHMQGTCPEKTRAALFLADHWDPAAYEFWLPNLRRIKESAHLEMYLLTRPTAAEINLR